MTPRSLGLLLLVASAWPAAAQDAPRPKPKLVVFITVDQLRPDYLERWDPQFTGGFRTLLDRGTFLTRAVQDHAVTETAPGHASTLSGRFPYSTGISSNSAGVNTPTAPLVGDKAGPGASPFRFRGTVLIDWMKSADSATRALSVSRKDRGAILPMGRGRNEVYWWAPASGSFVTSTWYADSLPNWVRDFNATRPAHRYAGTSWDLLLPASAYPEPDSVPAETSSSRFMFPHAMFPDTARMNRSLASTPFMDEVTLAMAWRGVRALDLGGGDRTDLLAVSLSTTDAVGHTWGPDSRELHDQVVRLDRYLGVFLDSLFALRGEANVLLALTADHGVSAYPEVRSRWDDNAGARRVATSEVQAAMSRAAPVVQASGIDPTAISFDWPVLEVDRAKVAGKERELARVATAIAVELRRVRGMRRVDIIDELANADTVRDQVARRWLHMARPGGGLLMGMTLEPHYMIGNGRGGSHGTPHDYDAQVPIIFMGAPFRAGVRDAGAARVVDIAPTLARVLGVKPLERLDGRALERVLRVTPP